MQEPNPIADEVFDPTPVQFIRNEMLLYYDPTPEEDQSKPIREEDYSNFVRISTITSPEDFYVLRYGNIQSLRRFEYTMTNFYRRNYEKDTLIFDPVLIKRRQMAVLFFYGAAHRVQVLDIVNNGRVLMAEVRHLDYGFKTEVPLNRLYRMLSMFGHYPQQAISCKCAFLKFCGGTTWTLEAIARFRKFVENKTLVADVLYLDETKMQFDVVLYDTSKPDVDVVINDRMIDSGYAVPSDM